MTPNLEWPDDFHRADELLTIAVTCAREFSADYNDQQDLASEALLAVLLYAGDIQYPRQFLRMTIRNLCIDRSRSIGARELNGIEWETLIGRLDSDLVHDPCDPSEHLALRETIERMESSLSPGEHRCYDLMRRGYEQRDLPGLLSVSRQAVSRMIASIRRKYLRIEGLHVGRSSGLSTQVQGKSVP